MRFAIRAEQRDVKKSTDRGLHTEEGTSCVLVLVNNVSGDHRHLKARCFCEHLNGAAKFWVTDLCPEQVAQEQLCIQASRLIFWKQAPDGMAALALIRLGIVLLLCPTLCHC